jgi:hypothetical protein
VPTFSPMAGDRSRQADSAQWMRILHEMRELLDDLETLSPFARAKANIAGFSNTSPGFGAPGRGSDPSDSTGSQAVAVAMNDEPRRVARQRMELQTELARNALRAAVAQARSCRPADYIEADEERCGCGTTRNEATRGGARPGGWSAKTSQCEACRKRTKR